MYLTPKEIGKANKFILDLFTTPNLKNEYVSNAIECSRHFSMDNSKIITS